MKSNKIPSAFYKDKVAAITGAGSGIGQALAFELASLGCHLSLSDITPETLTYTVQQISKRYPNIKVLPTVLDTRSKEAIDQWANQTFEYFGRVHFNFNNAGVALFAPVAEMAIEDLKWVMDVNFWGMVYGTQAFLPLLEHSGEGHIINVSSLFGLIAEPSQSAYNASKYAIRGFTEALIDELKGSKSKVSAYCVMPGGIKTNIANSARIGTLVQNKVSAYKAVQQFNVLLRLSPALAAQTILSQVAKGQPRILVGTDAKLLDVINRFSPAVIRHLMSYGPNMLERVGRVRLPKKSK